jgi:ubiquinone/menaquinone biosynthesis C-methylase UbiE
VSNDEVYASGLLIRALDPATQPPEIRAFMQAEIDRLGEIVAEGMSWLDVGCGTGRHLTLLRDRVRLGVGVDYESAYVVAARQRSGPGRLHFVAGDATRLPLQGPYDLATCLTNTWGTMSDKRAVLDEMRRCAPQPTMRLLSVFSESSVPARREWYRRFGHRVVEESDEWLVTDGGLRSEHFTEARLRALIGNCTVTRCTQVAYVVRF